MTQPLNTYPNNYFGTPGLAGGAGGIGVAVGDDADASFLGTIVGGAGGADPTGGGAGGLGIAIGEYSQVYTYGAVVGGAGGKGGTGGDGAAGATVALGATLDMRTSMTGGAGGEAYGLVNSSAAGNGGAAVLASRATVNNYGGVTGGAGGESYYGPGGNGGAGISMTDTTLNNHGAIINGGDGGPGVLVQGVDVAANGTGGAGVYMSGGALNNYSHGPQGIGTITGGFYGGAGVAATAGATIDNQGLLMGGRGVYTAGTGVDLSGGAKLFNHDQVQGGYSSALRGSAGIGVDLHAGTTAVNELGASIEGGYAGNGANGGAGVRLDGGTLTTYGGIDGGTYELGDGGALGAAVNFGAGFSSTLIVGSGSSFEGDITGFARGDVVDVVGLSPGQVRGDQSGVEFDLPGKDTLIFSGVTAQSLTLRADGHGGTLIQEAACFRSGTRIATPSGDVAIDKLAIGDAVRTRRGAAQRIRWIGRRRYSGLVALGNRDVLPVLIRCGALSEGIPTRDLWVSPEHAMWVDGLLVPARALVNGKSIVQQDTTEELVYLHLEFEGHEIIFAEGAPTESYADDDSRWMFDNSDDYVMRYPRVVAAPARFCAERVEDGAALEAINERLAGHHADARMAQPAGHLRSGTHGFDVMPIS